MWNGGAEGIRTPDPHNAIVVLYQLSYDPIQRGQFRELSPFVQVFSDLKLKSPTLNVQHQTFKGCGFVSWKLEVQDSVFDVQSQAGQFLRIFAAGTSSTPVSRGQEFCVRPP